MISIVIPVFNMEKYLEECLNSLYEQSENDFEIIIVDDGSTDCSFEIIKSYENKFKNYFYFSQENQGVAYTRNFAIGKCTREYLMFIDADDLLESNAIKTLFDVIKESNPDLLIFRFSKFYNGAINNGSYVLGIDKNRVFSTSEAVESILSFEIKGYLCDKLFRREIWISNRIVIENQKYTEDWFPMVKFTSKSRTIVSINQTLYHYRQHTNSAINQKNINVIIDYKGSVEQIIDFLKNETDLHLNENLEKFNALAFNEIIHAYYDLNKNNKYLYREFRKQSLNKNSPEIKRLLKINTVPMKNKIAIIAWKLKIYHLFKR